MAKAMKGTAIPSEYATILKKCGIKAATIEEATPLIGKKLAEFDIPLDVENEDFDFIVQMLDTMYVDADASADPDEEEDVETAEAPEPEDDEEDGDVEDDDVDALADEVEEEEQEKPAPKPAKKAAKQSSKPKAEEPVEDDDEENAPEEEDPAPKPAPKNKKAAAKTSPAPAKEKKAKEVKEKSAKPSRIDPKNNDEDRELFADLAKVFPETDFAWDFVSSAGVTVKHKGANSKRGMFLIENCSALNGKIVSCNLYMNTFGKAEKQEKLDAAGLTYDISWNGLPFFKRLSLEEAVDIVSQFKDEMISTVQTIDKRLGNNRKKMEESLSKDNKAKPAPKPAKKAAKVKTEDEFDAMDRSALKKYISANNLKETKGVRVMTSMSDDDIRAAIRKAIAE